MMSRSLIHRSFDDLKSYLRMTLVILSLNGICFIILIGDDQNNKIVLIPISITIPILIRFGWLLGDSIKKISQSYNNG